MSNTIIPPSIACFENIIGLSENDCECFDENTGWDISYSGVYLDKAEGLSLKMIEATKDCENENNLWLIMDNSRSNAIRQFISDSNNRLLQKYLLARSNFYGNVGRLDFKNNRNISKNYASIVFATANIAGGYAHIKTITTCFSAIAVKALTIYNNLNEVIGTVNLDTINGRKVNNVDITLPLWDARIPNLVYYFVYSVDPANPCKDNILHCNCGGIHYDFNLNKPYYKSVNNKLEGWAKYFMVGNYEFDTIDFNDCVGVSANYMNGLTFGVDLYCDLSKQFCFENPDVQDPVFISLALAIQHLAAYKLIIEILSSPNVSRYTMVGGENLQALMTLHLDKYNELLDWLIKNANTANTNCLVCRDNIKIGVGTL